MAAVEEEGVVLDVALERGWAVRLELRRAGDWHPLVGAKVLFEGEVFEASSTGQVLLTAPAAPAHPVLEVVGYDIVEGDVRADGSFSAEVPELDLRLRRRTREVVR